MYQTKSTGGRWTHNEQQLHINALEMKAAFFALQTFCQDLRDRHVHVMIDNTTAIMYINNMGGSHSAICNSLATLQAEPFFCLLDFGVLEKGSA